jgi:RNA polymerase sigma-70 factor (ECF subfamily)
MVSLQNAGPAYALDEALTRASRFPAWPGATTPARVPARRDALMADIDPLIQRAQSGDSRALREMLERYRQDVVRIAFRALGPSADLEDVVQEALVQIYRSLPSYRGESKFSTWVYRVVTNVARMHLRAARSRPALGSEHAAVIDRLAADAGRPDSAAERNERLRALYVYLSALSDKKRTVLVLHDLSGVSPAEIAEIVGAPVMTVRTRLFYARKELYAALAKDPALGDALAALREQSEADRDD